MAETAVAPEPSATQEVERRLGAFETEVGRGERLHRRRRLPRTRRPHRRMASDLRRASHD